MRNLVLTGFMGTGKTAVGREVARRLRCPFVDMDAEIEARAGKPIPRIFAEEGERAFRRLERALCEELSARQGLVISTGGGTLVDPANRKLMSEGGVVVCLRCDAEEILRRVALAGEVERPLLDVPDPRVAVGRLLREREPAYATIPWQIDTTDLSVEEVVERVVALGKAVSLQVRHPGGRYDVRVGRGMLAHVGGALRCAGVSRNTRVAVVSNPVVYPLYGAQVEEALWMAGLSPFPCSVPDGEAWKTLESVIGLYDQFLEAGLDRSGVVVSLGGGVTGDVAGFAAATFMRGVRFAQVPTTLLAMIDASVGGKTGVNLDQGKNLAGAFKQPLAVVIDPEVLATLEVVELRSGLAELIKHGVIGDAALFEELEAGAGDLASWWSEAGSGRIARALRVKIDVVEDDPYEQGRRAVLNLGHTVGHALEKLSGFGLRHGEGVSLGMVAAARIAAEMGRCAPSLVGRIERTLSAWGLPIRVQNDVRVSAVWRAMAHDKKRRGDVLRWVLPRAVGEVEIVEGVPPGVVKSVLREMGASEEGENG